MSGNLNTWTGNGFEPTSLSRASVLWSEVNVINRLATHLPCITENIVG